MELSRPDLLPDPDLDRDTMIERQHSVATLATFTDDGAPAIGSIDVSGIEPAADRGSDAVEAPSTANGSKPAESAGATVVGVDQAFTDETVVSVAVVIRDGRIVEQRHATRPLAMPYVPGLLVFREGLAICDALAALEVAPDVVCFDGSGRIHYRQAGLATHLGVVFDVPAVGVAKNLLCGTPSQSLAEPLPAGERVPIAADKEVSAPAGTVLGYAFQSRQFESDARHVNPLYVSPGHRLAAETAVDIVDACGGAYKLPEPIRIADRRVGQLAAEK